MSWTLKEMQVWTGLEVGWRGVYYMEKKSGESRLSAGIESTGIDQEDQVTCLYGVGVGT